jgi:hypothetical protein
MAGSFTISNPEGLTVNCDILAAGPATEKQTLEIWRTPGMDGVGAQRLGKNDSHLEFRAVLFGLVADVVDWGADLFKLQGAIGVVVDDWGTTYNNVLFVQVHALQRTPAHLPGVAQDCRGEVRIEGIISTPPSLS